MTGELRQFRAYTLNARDLAQAVANQEEFILTIGRSKVARLYVLPRDKWQGAIAEVYGLDAEQEAHRTSTRTTRDELDEATMMRLLIEQVDKDWQPARFGILTLDGADAAYLVPANEYWRRRVNGEQETQHDA